MRQRVEGRFLFRFRFRFVALSGALGVVLVVALGVAGCASPAKPDASGSRQSTTIVVYAAASLADVFEEIGRAFSVEHPGIEVRFSFGGSSALAEQLRQGAPGAVFAAANDETMTAVVDAGLVAGTPVVFATNTLAIAVPPGNPGRVTGLVDFAKPELAIGLCAVEVPCGAASAKLLALAGVTAEPDTFEQDVRAVLTKVQLGELDAGLVYRTDVRHAGAAVEGIDVDSAGAVVNRYPIATLTDADAPDVAREFVAFVLSDAGVAILAEAGFGAAG